MKIYTKKGDAGMTSLFGGKNISKANIRIEAYGTVDELNSQLGVVIALSDNKTINTDLLRIQKQLFNIGAILATNPDKPELLSTFNDEETVFLENSIDKMEKTLDPLKNFLLPSGSLLIANVHVTRTVCRRAERRIVAIMDTKEVYSQLMKYINRLSDYLFVLSRKFAKDNNITQNIWE